MQVLKSSLRWAADPRALIPLIVWLGVMLMLSLERAALLATMPERFDASTPGQVATAFLVGLRFDVVVASMLAAAAVAATALTPSQWIERWRWVRASMTIATAGALACFAFFCVVDYYFFKQFDQRLNHKSLVYLEYDSTLKIIWDQWPVVPALLGTLTFAALAGLALRPRLSPKRFRSMPLRGLLGWVGVVSPLLFLGIRNSVGPKAINQGPAFFSPSATLAQLTLNGGFTLRETIWSLYVRHEELSDLLPTPPEDESLAIAKEAIARPNDRFLGDPDNPLRRVTDTGQPEQPFNVVLVVLESMGWHYVGAMGGDERLTPNLDALIEQGVFMEQCYSVGRRTTAGFSGIVCGYPDLPGESVTTRPEAQHSFLTLGHVLGERGYETMFIYAGQPMYDHRQSFLRSNGFTRMVFDDDFASKTFRNHLGWSDEDLFAQADREFRAMGDEPFFATLLTLSFHRPYTIPPDRIEPVDPDDPHSDKLDSIRYTDWAIGKFMERARESEYFDRTIFVFAADHMGDFNVAPIEPDDYRVPFLIYAPGILGDQGRRIPTVCSQTDIAPTIMSLLGGEYTHSFFGSNVLDRSPEEGFAVFQDSNAYIGLIDADRTVVKMPFNASPRLMRMEAKDRTVTLPTEDDPHAAARLRVMTRRAAGIVQAAETLFERGAYRMTPAPAEEVAVQTGARRPPSSD